MMYVNSQKHRKGISQVFYKKVALNFFSKTHRKKIDEGVSFLINLRIKASNLNKRDTPEQAFSCEFCEILKMHFLWTSI